MCRQHPNSVTENWESAGVARRGLPRGLSPLKPHCGGPAPLQGFHWGPSPPLSKWWYPRGNPGSQWAGLGVSSCRFSSNPLLTNLKFHPTFGILPSWLGKKSRWANPGIVCVFFYIEISSPLYMLTVVASYLSSSIPIHRLPFWIPIGHYVSSRIISKTQDHFEYFELLFCFSNIH